MIVGLAHDPVDQVVEALKGRGCKPRQSGDGWAACCPAHEDKSPSLSVSRGDDGRALVHCHAGCSIAGIARAIGLEVADLFVEASSGTGRRSGTSKAESPSRTFGSWRAALRGMIGQHGDPETVHEYKTTDGLLVGIIARFRKQDGGKDIRPSATPDNGATWTDRGFPSPRPLLYLSDVLAAETVFVVEGEKCADVVRSLGLVATTAAHGSQSPHLTDWSPLVGKRVVMLPDNDPPGDEYVATAVRLVTGAGGADIRTVRVADLWQACPVKGDVADWLAAIGDRDGIRRAIEEAAEATAAARPVEIASSAMPDPEAAMYRGVVEPTTAPPCAAKAIEAGSVADVADVLARMEEVLRPTALAILRAVNMNAADPLDDRALAATFDEAASARQRRARDAMSVPGIREVHDGPRPRFVPDGLTLYVVSGDPSVFILECPAWRRFGNGGRATLDAAAWCDAKKAQAAIVAQLPGLSLEPVRGFWQKVWEGQPDKPSTRSEPCKPAVLGLRVLLEREALSAGRWREETSAEKHRGRGLLEIFREWMNTWTCEDDPAELTSLLATVRGRRHAPIFHSVALEYFFRPEGFVSFLDTRNHKTDRGELRSMWEALEGIVGKLGETRRKDGGRNGPRWKVMRTDHLDRLDAYLDGRSTAPPRPTS